MNPIGYGSTGMTCRVFAMVLLAVTAPGSASAQNRWFGAGWWARDFGPSFSGSARILSSRVGNIDGSDPAPSVNPEVVPTENPKLQSGTAVSAGLGVNFYLPRAKAFRVAI